MQKVRNKTSQPLVVNCRGRVLHLLPGAYAVISDEELRGPEIQGLLKHRQIEGFQVPAAKEPKTSAAKGSKASRKRVGSGKE